MSSDQRNVPAMQDEDDHEGEDTAALKQPQRRKPRTVSHLEPARLQRKRQVDRRAQQALRERTKSHVQALEAEIASLRRSSEQCEREHRTQLETLQEQNARLREKLDRISKLACCDANDPTAPAGAQNTCTSFQALFLT